MFISNKLLFSDTVLHTKKNFDSQTKRREKNNDNEISLILKKKTL